MWGQESRDTDTKNMFAQNNQKLQTELCEMEVARVVAISKWGYNVYVIHHYVPHGDNISNITITQFLFHSLAFPAPRCFLFLIRQNIWVGFFPSSSDTESCLYSLDVCLCILK